MDSVPSIAADRLRELRHAPEKKKASARRCGPGARVAP
jgi:hypothetical protein